MNSWHNAFRNIQFSAILNSNNLSNLLAAGTLRKMNFPIDIQEKMLNINDSSLWKLIKYIRNPIKDLQIKAVNQCI